MDRIGWRWPVVVRKFRLELMKGVYEYFDSDAAYPSDTGSTSREGWAAE